MLIGCKNLTTYEYIVEQREQEEREAVEARRTGAVSSSCGLTSAPSHTHQQSAVATNAATSAGARQGDEAKSGPGTGVGEEVKYVRAPPSAGSRPASSSISAAAAHKNARNVCTFVFYQVLYKIYM